MSTLKNLGLFLLLAGCGSYEVKYTEDKDHPKETPEVGTVPPPETEVVQTDPSERVGHAGDNTVTALSYGKTVKLEGVSEIYSATKIINFLFFTGKDSAGNYVVGRMTPDQSTPEILPVGRFSDNNIVLQGKYTVLSNTEALYLSDDHEIIEVDLITLKAVGKAVSPCAGVDSGTFSRDGRWNRIVLSKLWICGKVDGALIEKQGAILEGYTGQPLAFEGGSRFSFDGKNLFHYQFSRQTLAIFDADFTREITYSTGNYLYNSPTASFVSDNNGGKWFFSCVESGCYRTEVQLSTQ